MFQFILQKLDEVVAPLLTILVIALMVAIISKSYMEVYLLVGSYADWAFWAAMMVCGTFILAALNPHTHYAFVNYLILALTAMGAIAITSAPALGLIQSAPVEWRWAILVVTTLPFGNALYITWARMAVYVKPTVTVQPQVKQIASGSESDRKSLPKPTESKGLLGFIGRVLIQKPKQPKALTGAGETDSNSETDGDSESETNQALYTTLSTLATIGSNGGEGSVSAAAERLGISRTWVNEQLKELYKIDPERVEQRVPNWVKRNMGTLAEIQ